jgi:hypothetical protein
MLVVVEEGVGVVVGVCVCPSPWSSTVVEEEAEQCCSAMFECISFFFNRVVCVLCVYVPQTSYTADNRHCPSSILCACVWVGGCVWNEKGASIRRRGGHIFLPSLRRWSVKSE